MSTRRDMDESIIARVKNDLQAREQFIAEHRSFVHQVATGYFGRVLNWENDDELSIAIIAFNRSLDIYDPNRGVPFLAFARTIVTNALIDNFRKEKRHWHANLDVGQEDEQMLHSRGEVQASWKNYSKDQASRDLADEVAAYEVKIKEFGLAFSDLVRACPKRRDARETLVKASQTLIEHPQLRAVLFNKKQLPFKELSLCSGIHLRTLERGRKYIIAVAVILGQPEEFEHLRSYVQLPNQGGESKWQR